MYGLPPREDEYPARQGPEMYSREPTAEDKTDAGTARQLNEEKHSCLFENYIEPRQIPGAVFTVHARLLPVVFLYSSMQNAPTQWFCYTRIMIGLMDCNNFFVSCERLFRPDLMKRPVAVLSSNDGCIVSRSQEVKDLGIPMGIPYFEVKKLCEREGVTLFSSNFTLYRDISARVMQALKEEFDHCEIYSVDEAFFEIPGNIHEKKLKDTRERIIRKTGIPVSIGVADTKTLAKAANRIAKKGSGVCVLTASAWKRDAEQFPVGNVWGIGRQTTAFLTTHNIRTVAELLLQDAAFIRTSLGVVGERLVMELRGIPVSHVGEEVETLQSSYMSTRSFGKAIMNKRSVMSALAYHASHLAERLREDKCVASKITIIARGSRHGNYTHRIGVKDAMFPIPTNDTLTFIEEAERLLNEIYDPEVPYKKAGVVVSGIEPEAFASQPLFAEKRMEKTRKLDVLADTLNSKFGSGTLRSAATLGKEQWQEQKKLKSKDYTTRWGEIPTVKAV